MATILIVDDTEDIREIVREYLEIEEYAVEEAEDGLTALDMLP